MPDTRRYFDLTERSKDLGAGAGPLSEALLAEDAALHVSAPIGSLIGRSAILSQFWTPLTRALSDLERRTVILIGGRFNGGDWIASTGFYLGEFRAPLRGVSPTRRPIGLRYGWFDRIENGRAVESYVILDVARFLIDAGQWPLAPPLGGHASPAPCTQDGIAFDRVNGAESLALVEAMIRGLMQYDGRTLASMGMRRFWTPTCCWCGPGGIGSARGAMRTMNARIRDRSSPRSRIASGAITNAASGKAPMSPRPAGRASRRRIRATAGSGFPAQARR